jgi:hypothetical protein
MFNLSEKSTEQKISSLVEEMVTSLNEAEKQKLLKELQYKKAKAARLNAGVKKNKVSATEIIEVVRKIRIADGWNIA